MSFAQFTDGNVFDQEQTTTTNQQPQTGSPNEAPEAQTAADTNMYVPAEDSQTSSSLVGNGPGEHEEGPGNPGEPVPINDYIPLLILGGLALMFYYHRKSTKINS